MCMCECSLILRLSYKQLSALLADLSYKQKADWIVATFEMQHL